MGKAKRVYSESFKEKAVSLSYQRENIKELADELGLIDKKESENLYNTYCD